jgi:hypothetical protein
MVRGATPQKAGHGGLKTLDSQGFAKIGKRSIRWEINRSQGKIGKKYRPIESQLNVTKRIIGCGSLPHN